LAAALKKRRSFITGHRARVEEAKLPKYQPPAMRVRNDGYTKKSPFLYTEGVQATVYRKER